jgi:hypothetical protein
MNPDRYRALTLRTLAAVCLVASFFSISQAQSEAARKTDKDNSGVDIVVQGALDSELQPLLSALEDKEQIQIRSFIRRNWKRSGENIARRL